MNLNPHQRFFTALFSTGLLFSAAMAHGQTSETLFFSLSSASGVNTYAGVPASDGTLTDIGFDVQMRNRGTGVTDPADTGVAVTRATAGILVPPLDLNILAPDLLSQGPAGSTLESVTIYLFVIGVNPDGTPQTFSVFDDFSGTGNLISTFQLLAPNQENQFMSFTVTGEQFLGGISITSDGGAANTRMDVYTEQTALFEVAPGLSATFVTIPEPSAALLGGMGSLLILRRRRKN